MTKTLMTLQKAEIDNIRQWMTLTEDKISRFLPPKKSKNDPLMNAFLFLSSIRMTTIGTSIAEVKENLEEHLELDSEFKKREV